MSESDPIRPQGEIVFYQPPQEGEPVRVLLEGETAWLTQRLIADLYGVSVKTVNEHLINIYAEDELSAKATIRKFRIVQTEGSRQVSRLLDHHNLDAQEIDTLNRITVMFLDQAEFRAQRRKDIHMHDWQSFLDKFLRDTELPVLEDAGSVSHDDALHWAHEQYDAFAERRRLATEAEAEARYVQDLRASAKEMEIKRKKPPKKDKS